MNFKNNVEAMTALLNFQSIKHQSIDLPMVLKPVLTPIGDIIFHCNGDTQSFTVGDVLSNFSNYMVCKPEKIQYYQVFFRRNGQETPKLSCSLHKDIGSFLKHFNKTYKDFEFVTLVPFGDPV